MIPIYSYNEAKKSILIRKSIIDVEINPKTQQKIVDIFGKTLSPQQVVTRILTDIRSRGDQALIEWTKKLDNVDIKGHIGVKSDEIDNSNKNINKDVFNSLELAFNRILAFHRKQPINSWTTSELGGKLGQLIRPIKRVGIYIPGGTAPFPSTVLMSAIPAVVAGTSEIIFVSPPDPNGKLNNYILASCKLIKSLKVSIKVFRVGGIQAIGALAYGTETIPKVDKIVGPGNLFVSLAKREVYGIVGIDGINGPTEAMILADETAYHELIAADLLAQAEHDYLAIPILVTTCKTLAIKVQQAIKSQLEKLTRKEIANYSLKNQGGIITTNSISEAIQIVNNFAPEHLSIIAKDEWDIVSKIKNAGGIFLGEMSCEVLGDYIAGPSHVMPTGGSAKYASPLSVLDFTKIISLVGLDNKTTKEIAPKAQMIALSEQLTAHAEALRRRTI